MSLLPHQERVIKEHNELVTKLNSLAKFLESPQEENVTMDTIMDLTIQLNIMKAYATILEIRITKFN